MIFFGYLQATSFFPFQHALSACNLLQQTRAEGLDAGGEKSGAFQVREL